MGSNEYTGVAQALQLHAEAAVEAKALDKVDILAVSGAPSHIFHIRNGKGLFEAREHATPARRYKANRIEDIARLAVIFAGVGGDGIPLLNVQSDGSVKAISDDNGNQVFRPCSDNGRIFVWIGTDKVQIVLDEEGKRRDTVVYTMIKSKSFDTLRKLEEAPNSWATQKELLSTLRIELGGVFEPRNLVDRVRTIKFKSDGSGLSVVSNSRDTFGRTVEAEVLGLGDSPFPEDVVVFAPVFDDLLGADNTPVRFPVMCAFDVDAANQRFRLVPKAGELVAALLAACRTIEHRLTEDLAGIRSIKIVQGSPS